MKADTGSEVSLFISPPNVELHISDRAIKERRLPSRQLKHTAVWRLPLLETHMRRCQRGAHVIPNPERFGVRDLTSAQ